MSVSNPKKALFFDIESHSVDDRWNMSPREFFRLGQYAWGRDGDVIITEDYDEMIAAIRAADRVIGHNIHAFDLSVLFGKDSTEPLIMARQGRVFDTIVHAALVYPPPDVYTDRHGHTFRDASKPERAMRFLSLDNLCFQFGMQGKIGDLKALAKKYGGFGNIPLDDPEFQEYARQDVHALRELAIGLLTFGPITQYHWREQLNAAIDAQNSRNGFTVDTEVAKARVAELAERREKILTVMVEKYGLPTEGKSPWASNAGKEAIMAALADHGITEQTRPKWTRTATGNLSLGGEVLIELTEGTEAEDLGTALAELKGQRSLAQLALDSQQSDGKAHPEITALQRSGRKSTTKPGLTVWSARGPKAIEKSYFTASPGCKLVEFDYSQADARIVAAYSGDTEFAKRFEEGGMDAHEISGRLMFGDEHYESEMLEGWETDQRIRNANPLRQVAKALGHAYAYRAAANTLSRTSGQPVEVAQKFVDAMDAAYPLVKAWQEKVTLEGETTDRVTNDWGRTMVISKVYVERYGRKEWRSRAFTQAPAMYGQSGTRELMVDALIRMLEFDIRLTKWLVAQVHDALVFDIPVSELEWAVPKIKELMETRWGPSDGTGMEIDFPVGAGEPADNWYEAGH